MATLIEEADAPSNTSTSYVMAAGDEFYGINTQGQSDWIRITLQAGQTYAFGAVGIGAASSGVTDPLLKLYNANGALLDADDDGGPGLTASLTYRANQTATYYIEVKALASDGDGVYGLAVTEGALPKFSTEMGAGILGREGDSWSDAPATPVTVTWGVRASGPAETANGDPTAFVALTAAQITTTRLALSNFSDVAQIGFTQVNPGGTTNTATMLVGAYQSGNDGAGAYAYFPGSTQAGDQAGDLWINNASVSQTSLRVGTYDYWVFLHELGHAMGLSHPGDYNAAPGVTITYRNSAQYAEDSNQFTVMSYFNATDTEPDAPDGYADTLMLDDIYALQNLYGANHATRAGNDTYGFNSTLGGAYDFTVNDDPLLSIWDGAGRDTLDLSGFSGAQSINLTAGSFSDVGGFKGNLSIAVGCDIENAVGGRGSDTMIGNALNNVMKGGRGLDLLNGGAGRDKLLGGGGTDGFLFLAGDGQDLIVDFREADDLISLGTDLWGGGLTKAQMISQFASVQAGNVVFDFGDDVLTLKNIGTLTGLADAIVLF